MENSKGAGQAPSQEEMLAQLRETFSQMPNQIPIYLFVDPAQDDIFSQTNRQVVRAFRELTDKITIREYSLDHELAEKWQVTASSTLLIAPETYSIRWLGAPMGEEARTFLETLLLVGMGQSQLSEQSQKVVDKIDGPRKVKIFVSATCPYCPQEALNAVKAAVARPDMISVEIVDIQARPDLAEQYAAHSVPQAYANEVLIGQGAQSEEVFVSSLLTLTPQTIFIPDVEGELIETDVVIVGGGPAGLTAGIYAERSGLKAMVVEQGALGGQVATTPVVENYPGFTQVGGKTLVDIMVSHALQYVQVLPGEAVVSIEAGTPLKVQTSRRKFHTKTVLLATGASHKHLGVPGEKRFSGRGVSYCSTCDGPLFKGRKVIMVGGGDSAVTEALHLHNMGVQVVLVHRRDTLRAQDFLKKQLVENKVETLFNTEIAEIRGETAVSEVVLKDNASGQETILPLAGVFIAIGYSPTVELAKSVGVELTDEGYIKHDRHRTNVPGVYAAGDVEGGYKQIVTAAGQGSEAALAIFEDLINPYWQREKAAS
jgi:thioredoxin reductase (NADPH)